MDDTTYHSAGTATPDSSSLASQFETMWNDAEPVLKSFLRAVTPDASLTDDLLQNTAITAFSKFEQFDQSKSFKAWTVGIARFEVLRSKRAYARSKVFYDSEVFENLCSTFEQKLEEFDDRADALRTCMEKLNTTQRELLAMRYEKNMNYQSIAETVNRAEGAIRTHICRLRNDLKSCIQRTMRKQAT